MKILLIFLTLTLLTLTSSGQYPFEKYPAIKYNTFNQWKVYDKIEKENKIHFTLAIPLFFENGDTLTIQFTSFEIPPFFIYGKDSSIVRLYRNQKQIQKFVEPTSTAHIDKYDTVRVADINGDNLKDVKIIVPQPGCGIAGMNAKVLYLFQNSYNTFNKISFLDMICPNRSERDFNSDSNFEIITMNLDYSDSHSYWTFNLYNYLNGQLICVNDKFDYPIMVQYLFRENYRITDKISREKMKDFSKKLPDYYDRK
jgi:hypothetical protein